MKLIVQRVKRAEVCNVVSRKIVGKIGKGLFVLVGFKKGDTVKQLDYLADKLLKLRIMSDGEDKMNLSVTDTSSEVLVVSQFTLYADTKGGNRPSFIDAEEPKKAKELFDLFIKRLKSSGVKIETGSFGDYMQIDLILDGPVTVICPD